MSGARQPMPVQVRDRLLALFEERGLRPGDRVPTEAEISALCAVGRSTAREAVKLLEQEGLVTVERGRGRFLSGLGTLRIERPVTRFESVTEMLEELGFRVRTAVLSVQEGAPTPVEQESLGLADGEPVVRLERLRFDGDAPLVYSVDTFPRSFVPAPLKHLDWSGSLTSLLAAHGHLASSSAARLQAVELPPDVARRHGLEGLGAWLLVSETVITPAGERMLYAEDYHRGDAFAFHVLRR